MNIEARPDGDVFDYGASHLSPPLTYDNLNPDITPHPHNHFPLVLDTNSGLWEIDDYDVGMGVMCEFGKLSNTSEYFKTLK